ncbi:N-acetylmuramoyl-L-alanine amidase [Aureispira anguillae]|uniref:N-acetylmuramoyl-L-alanine amidase n=1 Tax=Aureispira anguillae TaxID=2864201 RepID=A0A916DUT5_9BACT|nr:N-acetylmuramoyl-L-alanine amidase [Aureispira anguillae]BDS13002.1 N-acetylmuramoyl-L-alanine amidase [Aureispira anguillae]BDS13066.1 N-acetylmuramoyl-L-alanine amidase [Aureispira anguillae]
MIVIISNGHGGLIGGKYQTRGKRFTFSDGTTIYEGEFNRAIKNRVQERLTEKGIPFYDLVPEQKDINRKTRVARANHIYRRERRKVFLIEIHSNAGGGEGSEVFVSRGASTKSKALANWTATLYNKHFPESIFRGVKRKDWDVVALTYCPAILLEMFFMDNEQECKKYLLTKEGRDRIAAYVVDIIENFIKYHS